MKTELKAKFLQHILNKKKNEEGFTLIELLVVIIIIGILSAIALPAFLNQANKARASEAKTIVGSINRAQQAYILENPTFVTVQADFKKLELGVKTQTDNYTYNIGNATTINGVTVKALPTTATAPAKLKGFLGATIVGATSGAGGETSTITALCESLDPLLAAGTLTDPTPVGTSPNITGLTCNAATQKSVK